MIFTTCFVHVEVLEVTMESRVSLILSLSTFDQNPSFFLPLTSLSLPLLFEPNACDLLFFKFKPCTLEPDSAATSEAFRRNRGLRWPPPRLEEKDWWGDAGDWGEKQRGSIIGLVLYNCESFSLKQDEQTPGDCLSCGCSLHPPLVVVSNTISQRFIAFLSLPICENLHYVLHL